MQHSGSYLFAPDAEISILGGLYIDASKFDQLEGFEAEHFHRTANRLLFEAMRGLYERGEPVDVVTITSALRASGAYDAAGGAAYLSQIIDAVPSAANVAHHANIVRDRAHLRRLQTLAREIGALAESGKTAVEVQEEAERWIYAAGEGVQVDKPIAHIREGLREVLDRLERNEPDILTGFADYDRMAQGFGRGDLVILAARPSMGKTALGLQIALNVAHRDRKPVPVFSLEMSREAIARRLMFAEARVDISRFRREPQADEYARLHQAMATINQTKLYIHCTATTVREIRAQCRRVASKEGGLGLVMIDYLGKLRGSGRMEKRVHELGEITGDLKALAVEFDCPVLLLCQLSRAVEAREDKRPMLSDLRDSGEIEQDADTVLMLYRPEYYFGPTMKVRGKKEEAISIEGKAEVIVAKQRNGATGSVHLAFLKQYTRFENLYPDQR